MHRYNTLVIAALIAGGATTAAGLLIYANNIVNDAISAGGAK